MATEVEINGKMYRHYIAGGVWVADDGFAAYKNDKTTGIKRLYVKTEANGHKNIIDGKKKISMALAVITCFCKPKPIDRRNYEIEHIDGNPSNCCKTNLRWTLEHYKHTTANSVKMKHDKETYTVKKDGTVWINGKQEKPCDYFYDSDIDLHDCIKPHIKFGQFRNRIKLMDEIMKEAGYVNGDDAVLSQPAILHKDYDWNNFDSDNLEWVEKTDPRYLEYCKRYDEKLHDRRVQLNPGKPLYPGW